MQDRAVSRFLTAAIDLERLLERFVVNRRRAGSRSECCAGTCGILRSVARNVRTSFARVTERAERVLTTSVSRWHKACARCTRGGLMAFAPMLQTPWGCRWSRLTEPEPCAIKHSKASGCWLCVRPTLHLSSRLVRAVDCAACPYWESIEFGRIARVRRSVRPSTPPRPPRGRYLPFVPTW